MEFLSLSRRRSSARNAPATKSEEKRMFSQAKIQGIKSKMKNRKVVTIIQIVSLWKSCSRKFDTKAECSKTKWANNDIHSISEV